MDQDWIKPPLDSAAKTSPHCQVTSKTSFNPVAPSSPPPNRKDWGKLIGLAEDCTLCTQGSCGYVKPQKGDTHVNTTTWLSARHHNARRQRCHRVCTLMSAIPVQEDLTPVTPRRGPRTAMAKEKRKRKANLHTPHVEDSEAPTSTSFYKGESDSSKDTRGWSSSSEWSRHTIFSSDPSSLFELSTTTPESMEENSSTESRTSEEIDTRPIGPASIRSNRAHSWKKFMRRKPDS